MEALAPHEFGAVLLSVSFLAALVVGGIAGWLGGMMAGVGTGALTVSAFSLAAAWMTWQAGDVPDHGTVRVAGVVAIEAEAEQFARAAEPLANHELVIRYADEGGAEHRISGANATRPLAPGQAVKLDYPAGRPDRAALADPERHRTLLIVFLIFGGVPFAMSLVMFASAWEERAGARGGPPPRPPGLLRMCGWARVAANLAFVAGIVLTFQDAEVGSLGMGFPVIGAAALAHGVIGAVAGMRLSGVLTFVVVGVGFVGFGLLAQSVMGVG